MTHTATPRQQDCQPVHDEFAGPGGDVDLSLMGSDFADVVEDVTTRLVADPTLTQTHDQRELANGRAALKVMHSIGCASCDLSGVCGVEGMLRSQTSEGEAAERREMLASA